MFNVLSALALGIVIFAITVGVGVVVLSKFAASVAECGTGLNAETLTYNVTSETCYNSTGANDFGISTASTTTNALGLELGTAGLAGWTGAIVALAVGLLFIGALAGKRMN